ncbi:MAG: carboxypeptidase-like regulatory domain-containing protein [Deltaproteobacteria bacterium]
MRFFAGALALISVLGFSVSMAVAEDAAGPQANVVGTVYDADKNAIDGAGLVLLSTDGEEVGTATTAADGTYSLGCAGLGTYHLQLTSGSGFQGQKVAAPVGPNGLAVAWAVDSNKPALASATATGGACGVAAAAGAAPAAGAAGGVGGVGAGLGTVLGAVIGGGALVAGVSVGIASAAGSFNADSPAQ